MRKDHKEIPRPPHTSKTKAVNKIHYRKSLEEFAQALENLDMKKRIAVTKWLQGVIVVQILTTEERENIVKAANGYFKAIEEDEKIKAVDALIDYLEEVQTYCHCKVTAGESVNVRQISKTTET